MANLSFEQYQDRGSRFHRMDGRAKLIFSLVFILAVVLTARSQWIAFLAYLAVISFPLILSKLSLKQVLVRSLAVLPFALFLGIFLPFFQEGERLAGFQIFSWNITISREGVEMLGSLLAKSWLSILCLVWLTATTQVTALLQSLKKLRFPAILVTILFFMYRYIFVIVEEMRRMIQARDCRSSRGGIWWNIRTAGNMIGTLFLRSYERSERVYNAMSARGYDGQTRTLDELSFKRSDLIIMIVLLLAVLTIAITNFIRIF